MDTNPSRGVVLLMSAEYSVVKFGNFSDLTLSSRYEDILLCSEILVTDIHHMPEMLVPGIGSMPWARRMASYVRDGYGDGTQI